MTNYDPVEDILYETSAFTDELLKMMEIVGQAFQTMDQAVQWAAEQGVAFEGHRIKVGLTKGTHQWWGEKVAPKPSSEPQFSDIDCQVKNVDKGLLLAFLFAMRQNLHVRKVDTEDGLLMGSLDDEGQIVAAVDDHEVDRNVMEIGWIMDPVEFLCSSMGKMLNKVHELVQLGAHSNYGPLLRGSEGHLFEDLASIAHQTMIASHSTQILPLEGADHFDDHPQKTLVKSVKFLSAD